MVEPEPSEHTSVGPLLAEGVICASEARKGKSTAYAVLMASLDLPESEPTCGGEQR